MEGEKDYVIIAFRDVARFMYVSDERECINQILILIGLCIEFKWFSLSSKVNFHVSVCREYRGEKNNRAGGKDRGNGGHIVP